ncbi:hypothetical protein [Pedobacter steynii]
MAFLAFGESKAQAVKHVIEAPKKNTKLYPSQLINPVDGSVTWF